MDLETEPSGETRLESSDSATGSQGRSLWGPVAVGILVGVVYPVSYGPVMFQVGLGRLVSLWPVLDVLYAPIEWFAGSSDFGAGIVDWYLRLWGA